MGHLLHPGPTTLIPYKETSYKNIKVDSIQQVPPKKDLIQQTHQPDRFFSASTFTIAGLSCKGASHFSYVSIAQRKTIYWPINSIVKN